MKINKIQLDKNNRMLRIGFGKHEGSWFFRIDLWYIGYRFKKSIKLIDEKIPKEINYADISLVEMKNGRPNCKKHGAMNKMNLFEDESGYWRCISVISGGEFNGSKMNDNVCRAGCQI